MKYRHYSPTAPVILLEPTAPTPSPATTNGASSGGVSASSGSDGDSADGLAARLQQATEALLVELAASRDSAQRGVAAPEVIAQGQTPTPGARRGAQFVGEAQAAAGAATGSVPLDPPALELASQLAGGGPVGVLRTSLTGAPPGLLQKGPAVVAATGVGSSGASNGRAAGGESAGRSDTGGDNGVIEYVLGYVSRPADVAAELFAGLRALDEAGCAVIVVEGVLDAGAGVAVMNRLRKAASRVVRV
jgi:hypothetical protein